MSASLVLGICAIVLLAICVAGVAIVGLVGTGNATRSGSVSAAEASKLKAIVDRAGALAGQGWTVGESDDRFRRPATCMPAGLSDGQIATLRTIWSYRPVGPGDGEAGNLRVSIYQYGTSQQMAADLDRSATDSYMACLLTDTRDAYRIGAIYEETVTRQPPPLGLDGANYQVRYRLSAGKAGVKGGQAPGGGVGDGHCVSLDGCST